VSEALDAAEIGSPAERRMLLPLIKRRMAIEFSRPNYNKTLL
jgi:hypothetical protein